MRGGFVTDTGAVLESFGAVAIALRDASGNRLALRPGSSAVVRIPLASRNTMTPSSMPLFFLDEATGRWVEQGSAALRVEDGEQFFEAPIDRLAVWNVDKPLDAIFVRGCVNDASGQPAAQASVSAEGVDYSGADTVQTDAQGRFSVGMRRGGRAALLAESSTAASASTIVGPSASDMAHETCLVLDQAIPAPTILEQPRNAKVWADMHALFNIVASGGRGLAYQWKRNGADIPGATYSWLVVPQGAGDGDRYSVVVANAAGSVTSDEVALTVAPVDASARRKHLLLLDSLFDFYSLAAATLQLTDEDMRALDPAAVCTAGSANGTLNEGPLPVGQPMPSSGVLAARFDGCRAADGDLYTGESAVSYSYAADFSQGQLVMEAKPDAPGHGRWVGGCSRGRRERVRHDHVP